MTDLPQPTSPPHPNNPLPLGERLSGQTWQTWPETPALNVSDADIAADVTAALTSKGAAFDDEVGRALLHHFSIVSPYLMQLVRREPARLARVLSHDPDARFAEILAGLVRAANDLPPNASGFAEGMKLARRAKAEAALLIAVADIGCVWDIGRVTRALTSLADVTLQMGLRLLVRTAIEKGDWRGAPEDAAPEASGGYFVLAMGKHGAGELNYSSDIDLIVFYDQDRCLLKDPSNAKAVFVRLTQALVKFMSERTADGYVFRTDLRLRPDPGATQAAISTDSALHYYESFGQNWERAAMIKARAVAGDADAASAFLAELGPYVWRKYLDFASIADIHAMKRQIHAHKGHARIAVAGHDIKVGRGGIREIEFFAQTQQLIAGGRQPELRVPQTLLALKALADRRWVSEQAAQDLVESYRFLRTIEHRVQMVADEQTQKLPSDQSALERLAAFSGFGSLSDFEDAVARHLRQVQRHYADLFEDAPSPKSQTGNLVFIGEDDDPETVAQLQTMGFKDPVRAVNIVRSWHRGRYRAMASKVTRERLTEIQGVLLEALGETVDPDAALVGFDRMLAQLPAGVQLFSLFRAHPRLLRLVADITGSAPRLARSLARRRRVLDVLLDPGELDEPLPPPEHVRSAIRSEFADAASYEDALDIARVIGSEQSFLIGSRLLSGAISGVEAGRAYANLAETVICELHDRAAAQFATDHGVVPGRGSVVIAMGKLGGREMTAASDLDLIVVYDADDSAKASTGPRELAVSQYYARFTQRLIAALSAPTAQGGLFEVDLRLRPSGQKGPVATNFASFRAYQETEAWIWEHMALTRARTVAGPQELQDAVSEEIRKVLMTPRDPVALATAVRDMRARIAAEKGSSDLWDLKQVRGGLVDLEFIAQYLQLRHAADHPEILSTNTRTAFERLDRNGLMAGHGERLIRACDLVHELTQILRLCFDGQFKPETAPDGLKQRLADVAGLPSFAHLEADLTETLAGVVESFDVLVPESSDPS
jgi:glutamate-ammonia-ligase adenylyltransferase